ncbi:MAG: hypothetical protein ACTSRE_07215 [Promethearchaeota archaeon]
MPPRRNDRELVEQMINHLSGTKLVTTEGELASALNINSETANKWLELFLLIKKNCPDFRYKKLGRYRIIDMVGLGNLVEEISQAKLKPVPNIRSRITRFEALNAIEHDLILIARILIKRLKLREMKKWNSLTKASHKAFSQIINENVNRLVSPEGNDDDFQIFKSSLQTSVEALFKSLKNLETFDVIKPKLKLGKIRRDFIQKIVFITQLFEESELKNGKKADYGELEVKKPHKSLRSSVMSELKVSLDNLSSVLKKPKRDNRDRMQKSPKFIPVLRCISCNFERQFPTHCSRSMEYEDNKLICEKCNKRMSIPSCPECNQTLSVNVKEVENT